MITVVVSYDNAAGSYSVEKIVDWKNFDMPEDRQEEIELAIFQANRRYRGSREVSSRQAENLLSFFQNNPEFAPQKPMEPKGPYPV